jgi:hypothetical protein
VASAEPEKIEYEVVIFHDGKETIRTASSSNFTALAARATTEDPDTNFPGGGKPRRKLIGEVKPVAEPPKFIEPEKPQPLAVVPADEMKMPPVTPAPLESKKPLADAPPVPPPSFDFFNLAGKKAPLAK